MNSYFFLWCIPEIQKFSSVYFVFLQNTNEPIKLPGGQFGCPFCTVEMKKRYNMMQHILSHTGERPFACQYCSYATNRKSTLKKHIETCRNHIALLRNKFWKDFSLQKFALRIIHLLDNSHTIYLLWGINWTWDEK